MKIPEKIANEMLILRS